MGRLDARVNATKVGYPIVGEKTEDASNVIDYDIRSELSKDISAEMNANNQTTTGMANIIPGINAPKLIDDTSIYKKTKTLLATASSPLNIIDIYSGNSPMTIDLTQFTLTNESGSLKFVQTASGLKVPASGGYIFTVTYPPSRSDLTIVADLMAGTTQLHTHTCSTGTDVETFIVPLSVGDIIFYRTISTKVGSYANYYTSMSMDITKL